MRIWRWRPVSWGSVVSGFLVLAAAAGPAGAQGKPIRIGEINSYSGLATVYTFPYREGILMATKEINDAGGVLGRPLEFIFRDDKLKPDEAVKAAAAQGKLIRIGEINSYSGLATVYTFPYREGILMATKEINDAGGVLGRPLEFIFRDDKLKPDEAVKAARELVGQEKVDFLAGCISSGVGLAISAYAKEAKTLYFATHCQTSRLTWDDGHRYVAHTTNNVNQYIRALAKKAASMPYKKWAHISPDYEYGHNVWEEFIAYLKQLKPDVQVVQQNWPKLGETDHSPYITALLQSGAEAMLSVVWGAQEIAFVKQARPFGLFDKVQLFSASVGNPDELDPLGKEAPVNAVSPGLRLVRRGHAEAPSQARRVGEEVRGAGQEGADPRRLLGLREHVPHRGGHPAGEEHRHRQGHRRAQRRLRDGLPVGQGHHARLRHAGHPAPVGGRGQDERAGPARPGQHRGDPRQGPHQEL